MHHAILNYGGYLEVGFMLGRKTMREGREPLIKDKKELLEELKAFVKFQQRDRTRTNREPLEAMQGQNGVPRVGDALRDLNQDGSGGLDNMESRHCTTDLSGPKLDLSGSTSSDAVICDGDANATTTKKLGPGDLPCLPSERDLLNAGRSDMLSVRGHTIKRFCTYWSDLYAYLLEFSSFSGY